MTYVSTWSKDAPPLKPWSAACMAAIGICPVRFWGSKWLMGDIVKYPLDGVTLKLLRAPMSEETNMSCAICRFRGWALSRPARAGDVYLAAACVVIEEEYTEEEIAEANRQLQDEDQKLLNQREMDIVKQLVESVVLS